MTRQRKTDTAFVAFWAGLACASGVALPRAPDPLGIKTYQSPSGRYSIVVTPSTELGQGRGRYVFSNEGEVVWEKELPFTLWDAALTDAGETIGYAYSLGVGNEPYEDIRGMVQNVILGPDGAVRLNDRYPRDGVDSCGGLGILQNAVGFIVDPEADRFIARLRAHFAHPGELWRCYRISTGALLDQFTISCARDFEIETLLDARPVAETGLILLSWRYVEYDCQGGREWGGLFQLLDSEGRVVWDLPRPFDMPDSAIREHETSHVIVETSVPWQFDLRFPWECPRVRFRVSPVDLDAGKWHVEEIWREEPGGASPPARDGPGPSERLLGAASGLHRDLNVMRGRVTSAKTARPIEGATVCLTQPEWRPRPSKRSVRPRRVQRNQLWSVEAITDEQGVFELRGFAAPDESWNLKVRCEDGLADLMIRPADYKSTPIDVAIQRAEIVIDDVPPGLCGNQRFLVAVEPADTPAETASYGARYVPEGQCENISSDLRAPGRQYDVAISISVGNQYPYPIIAREIVDLAGGETRHVSFAREGGCRIIGRALDPDDNPLRDASVLAQFESNPGRAIGAVTDDDGAFVIEHVPPGDYQVEIFRRSSPGRTPVGRWDHVDWREVRRVEPGTTESRWDFFVARGARPQPGDLAPEFQGRTLEGETFSLAEQRGHPVLLVIGAGRETPDGADTPFVAAVLSRYAETDLLLVCIEGGRIDCLREWLASRSTPPTLVFHHWNGPAHAAFGHGSSAWLIGADGRILAADLNLKDGIADIDAIPAP